MYAPEKAKFLVGRSIDFASRLPEPVSRGKVNIHLNTLVSPEEWKDSLEYWQGAFDFLVKPVISEIIGYGKEKGVDILVETMIPRGYGDQNSIELCELFEPYPLLPNRGIQEIRRSGGKITFDTSHCDITAMFVRYCRRLRKEGIQNPHLYYGLFREDLEALPKNFHLFQYLEHLENGDHLHLSGSRGLFRDPNLSKKLGVDPSFCFDGIELGKGEMTKSRVAKIIKIAESKGADITVEIIDYDVNNPMQTERSVNFIAELYETGYL